MALAAKHPAMSSSPSFWKDTALRQAICVAAVFASLKLLLQFGLILWSAHAGYGLHRDEFYYVACGRHLAWGYVDHGPMVAAQARLAEVLFGDSVFGLRVFSALAGAAAIFLTGIVTWALGGDVSAQRLAMIALLVAPRYIGIDSYLSMNSFEPVFWTICVLALVLMVRGYSQRFWWVVIGVAAGLGLLNKASMLFFLIAVAVGLFATPQRRLLFTRWAALGVAILMVLAMPNVIWQMVHGWPTLEFLRSLKEIHRNSGLQPGTFLVSQIAAMHPFNVVLWLAGVVVLLRGRLIANVRWLGIAFLVFYAMMFLQYAKDYYLLPIYPAFLAAGAIAWKNRAAARLKDGQSLPAFSPLEFALVVTGILIVPVAIPLMSPEGWLRYTLALDLRPDTPPTTQDNGLPMYFSDHFGWQEQSDAVVRVFHSLNTEEQRHVCIYTDNFGEAAALGFLGKRQEPSLPEAISGNNNYWLWGPRGCSGELMIALSSRTPDEWQREYRSVTLVTHTQNKWATPYENKSVYLLRDRLPSAPFDWAKLKNYS